MQLLDGACLYTTGRRWAMLDCNNYDMGYAWSNSAGMGHACSNTSGMGHGWVQYLGYGACLVYS